MKARLLYRTKPVVMETWKCLKFLIILSNVLLKYANSFIFYSKLSSRVYSTRQLVSLLTDSIIQNPRSSFVIDDLDNNPLASSNGTSNSTRKRRSRVELSDGFNIFCDAFLEYKRIYSNAIIPTNFSFTHEMMNERYHEIPHHLVDYRLGATITQIRYRGLFNSPEYVEKLSNIGFQVNPLDSKFEQFLKALSIYKCLYGNTRVPRSYKIDIKKYNGSVWPLELHGMALGVKVSNTRSGQIFYSREHLDKLNSLGFDWDARKGIISDVTCAVNTFRQLHGHVNIPSGFIVPNEEPYESRVWGMRLGQRINNLKYRGDFIQHHYRLHEAGLGLDRINFDIRHWNYILEALKVYKSLYNDLRIPFEWSVPYNNPNWPMRLWGLKLGYRANNIKYRGDYIKYNPDYFKELNDLGFFSPPDRKRKRLKCEKRYKTFMRVNFKNLKGLS